VVERDTGLVEEDKDLLGPVLLSDCRGDALKKQAADKLSLVRALARPLSTILRCRTFSWDSNCARS